MANSAEDREPAHVRVTRALSFIAALVVSAVLLLDPYVLGTRLTWQIHSGLPLMITGISLTFAYALGFRPGGGVLHTAFHPSVGWLLLGLGAVVLAAG